MIPDHLKIPAITPRVQYVGNGVETTFTYPFPIFEESNLAIWFNAAPQIVGYTVTGAEETNGGTVIFAEPPAEDIVVTIERRMPLQRITDFLEGGDFSAQSLNTELDYLAALIQQIDSDSQPMLRFDNSEAFDVVTIPSKTARSNKVFGFDGAGNPTVYDTTTTYSTPNFTATGAGAITRSLTDKARDIASIFDYGAVGDGLTDDTLAFQTALASEDSLYIPSGTYLLSSTLEITDGQHIFGAGQTTILKANGDNFDAIHIIGSYVTLFNLRIEGGDNGLRLWGKTSPCSHNTIQNITFDHPNTGIELDGYNTTNTVCDWNSFNNITILGPTIHGVYLTLSGGGISPKANSFRNVRVISGTTPITGHGFYAEEALFNNSFIDCEANLNNDGTACFRIGGFSNKTLMINIFCQGNGDAPNVQLDAGSSETSITNLFSNDVDAVILDNSGGEYMAFNAGFPGKNRLRKTQISDLIVELQRFDTNAVALASEGNVTLDLTKTTQLVDASNGETTLTLPDADEENEGAIITVKKTDSSNNLVIIEEDTGNGADNKDIKLGNQYDYATVMSDGTSWHIINTNTMAGNAFSHSSAGIFKPDLTHDLYLISCASGAVTVELPPADSAQSTGRMVTLKKVDATATDVTITEEGGSGPDNASAILGSRYDAITLMSDGTVWHIVSTYDA